MEQTTLILSREEFKTLLESLKELRAQVEQIWTELPDKHDLSDWEKGLDAIEKYEEGLQRVQSNLRAQAIALSTILLGADIFSNEDENPCAK